MRAKDPKQAVINILTNSNPQMRREEMGTLAKLESIIFLKEKNNQSVHVSIVLYTSTTNQNWCDTSYVVRNVDSSFSRQSGVSCRAEDRFHVDRANQGLYQNQPYLSVSMGGGRSVRQAVAPGEPKGTTVQEITESNEVKHTLKIASATIIHEPAEDVPMYRFLVGCLAENSQDVASVRMIPQTGYVEEDKVEDGTVLFLGEFSFPITFEFYNSAHMLLGTQLWDV